MSAKRTQRGFTLIELLVVIAIIGVLAAILIPTINNALNKAREASVRTSVIALETALKTYFQEYGKWPISGGTFLGEDADESTSRGIEMKEDIVAMLTGDPVNVGDYDKDKHNPKGRSFLEIQEDSIDREATGTYKNAYVDIWGNPYKFLVDANYDNRVRQGDFADGSANRPLIKKSVIVWSRGEDGEDDHAANSSGPGWDDDIRSW